MHHGDNLDTAFFRQRTVENQMLGKTGDLPGAEARRFGMGKRAGPAQTGCTGELLEGRLGAGREAIRERRFAHFVGELVALGDQVGAGRRGNQRLNHDEDGAGRGGL